MSLGRPLRLSGLLPAWSLGLAFTTLPIETRRGFCTSCGATLRGAPARRNRDGGRISVFYVDTGRNILILLFRDGDGVVQSLYWSTGAVGNDNLSGTAGAPPATGDPVGYYVPGADMHHVVYRGGDGHLHELDWVGLTPVVYGGNLTGTISAPKAAGNPPAFGNAAGVNIVVYRSTAGEIRRVYWSDGPSGLDELSGVAGTPAAAGDPVAYYTAHDDTHQVVYLGDDGHLWELYWQGVAPVAGWNLTAPSGAPALPQLVPSESPRRPDPPLSGFRIRQERQ